MQVGGFIDDPVGVKAFDEAFFPGTMTPEILGGGRGTLAPGAV